MQNTFQRTVREKFLFVAVLKKVTALLVIKAYIHTIKDKNITLFKFFIDHFNNYNIITKK